MKIYLSNYRYHWISPLKIAEKWNTIVDEMIWSFEQVLDDESDEKFWTDGIDWDGLRAHNKRIDKGLALFGKYYRNLWD
jgi:hypothetical protein